MYFHWQKLEDMINVGGATLIIHLYNDDETDNRFKEECPRFPQIEEDEPPYRLLCTEYPKA